MSLESQVEAAYSAVLRTYQTELAAVRINLAASGITQTTTEADDNSGRDVSILPIPCIRLRASSEGEFIGSNTPKFAVTLEIEAEQRAQLGDGDGLSVEDLFALAVRPFWYGTPTLASALGSADSNLRVHGITGRLAGGVEQEAMEASHVRRGRVTIHCAPMTFA